MTKKDKIIYWIATIWLSLGMVSTGIVQLMKNNAEVDKISVQMGYPVYFLIIIGVWKLLGVVAVLIPKFPLLKEWAYAGFFFLMTGAILSHYAVSDPALEYFGPFLLLLLTFISWYYRPNNRKVHVNQI